MKKRWKSLSLLFLFAVCCLGFQSPRDYWGSGKVADNYPPDFPNMTKRTRPFIKEDTMEASKLYALLWKMYNSGQFDSMAIYCQKMIPIGEKLLSEGFDSLAYDWWSFGYSGYAQAQIYLGEIEEGSQMTLEFDEIDYRVYPKDYLSRAIGFIGLGHMASSLFDDSDLQLDYYRRAEAAMHNCRPPGDNYISWPYLWLGYQYCHRGEFEKGLSYLHKILNLEHVSPDMKWFAYDVLADVYGEIGDYKTAKAYLLRAREFPPFNHSILSVDLTLFDFALKQGDLDAARKHLLTVKKIIAENQPTSETKGRWRPYFNGAARLAMAQKDYREAILWLNKSLEVTEKARGGKVGIWTIDLLQNLSETLLLADSLPAAQTTLSELLARESKGFRAADFAQNPPAAAFSRQPYHLRTLELKGRFFEKMFQKTSDPIQLENALSTYALADSLVERIRDTYRGVGSKNQLSGAAKPIFQRTMDCAFQLWQRTGEERYLRCAWQAAEKSKSVELLESLRETEAKQLAGFRPEDQRSEKMLKRDLDFYEKLVFDEQAKPRPDSSRISNWNRKIFDLKSSQDSLLAVFQKRYPEYHRQKYDRRLASIADVQAKLPADNALVEYFLGDSVLFTFLIDRSGTRLFRQKIDSSFHHNLAALRVTVHDFDPVMLRSEKQKHADFQNFTAASHSLYQTLLATPLAHSQTRKLVVVPDDQIGYVPFAALLREPIAATTAPDYRHLPYLVRDIAVRLEYSGTLLTEQSKTSGSGGGYFGMAPAYEGEAMVARALPDSSRFARAFSLLRGGEVPALRFNRAEIDSTHGFFSGQTASGKMATEAFFRKNAPNSNVLHLAMHALTNDTDPLYSTLLFSNPNPADSTGEDDGFLHAFELYKLRLHADLAVLSACNTGAGKVVRGEGIMSMARAFRFAGCPNVMMSLWSVNDAAAKDLVVGFFEKLSGGMGKASALQAAQQDFLKNTKSDELTHPYFWATFSMVGDDEPVHSGGGGLLIWGLLVLVLGLIWLVLRPKKVPYGSQP